MASALEYHYLVRRLTPSSVGIFCRRASSSLASSLLLLSALFVCPASAQINGAPASVTSPGFGGRAINGPPASVTSLGPNGYSRGGYAPSARGAFHPQNGRLGSDRRRHRHHVPYAYPYAYAVPFPYEGYADGADNNADDSDDNNYQGGPTIFDRRGSGASSYLPPVEDAPMPRSTQAADASTADPDPPQQPTVLIFKDGHKLDVQNYAIVGQTLFDLTPGHARKVALVTLDLEATRQLNDDRGIQFQLPPVAQAN